jgi:hypothetical protein
MVARTLKNPLAAGIVAAALILPAAAHAGENRAGAAIPKSGYDTAKKDDKAKPTVGPKDGFPDNRGIDRAYERSNEHSALHRNDSKG